MAEARARRLLSIGWLAIAVFAVWMRASVPVFGIAQADYDDGLFLRLARSIADGQWLGGYDDRTLIKGPMYPAFIAVSFLLHVPLKWAEQIVYVLAAWLLARFLARRNVAGRLAWLLGTVTFVLLCLNPLLWHPSLARVVREGLYIGLSLGVMSCLLTATFPVHDQARQSGPLAPGTLFWGGVLGVVAGAFWITREEGVWLIPLVMAVGVIALVREVHRARARDAARGRRFPWPRRTLSSFVSAAVGFAVVVAGISSLNDAYYHVFAITEVKARPFRAAYGALARIQHEHWQRYVVFPHDARVRAYAVSATTRELVPTLEGDIARQWASGGCAQLQVVPCTETLSGWFLWQLRDAAARAGYYTSARDAARFYRRLASEIDAACDQGRLQCLPRRATLAPPFRWSYLGDTLAESRRMLSLLLGMGNGDIGPLPSLGSRADIDAISDVVGPVAPARATIIILRGWAAAPSALPTVQLQPRGPSQADVSLTVLSAEDVEATHPNSHAVRFVLTTNCPREECDLVVTGPGPAKLALPLTQIASGQSFTDVDLTVDLESVADGLVFPASQGLRDFQRGLAGPIAHAYARGFKVLWLLGCLGLLLGVCVPGSRKSSWALTAVAVGSALAVVVRVVLLSYLEVTSIPSENVLYLSPASPFVIVSATTGLFLGARALVRLWRSRRVGGSPGGGGHREVGETLHLPPAARDRIEDQPA